MSDTAPPSTLEQALNDLSALYEDSAKDGADLGIDADAREIDADGDEAMPQAARADSVANDAAAVPTANRILKTKSSKRRRESGVASGKATATTNGHSAADTNDKLNGDLSALLSSVDAEGGDAEGGADEAEGNGVGDEFTMFTENPELKQVRMRLDHIVGAFESTAEDDESEAWTKAIRSPVGVAVGGVAKDGKKSSPAASSPSPSSSKRSTSDRKPLSRDRDHGIGGSRRRSQPMTKPKPNDRKRRDPPPRGTGGAVALPPRKRAHRPGANGGPVQHQPPLRDASARVRTIQPVRRPGPGPGHVASERKPPMTTHVRIRVDTRSGPAVRDMRGPPPDRVAHRGPVARDARAPPAVRDARNGPVRRDPRAQPAGRGMHNGPPARDLRAQPAGRGARNGPGARDLRTPVDRDTREVRTLPGGRDTRNGPDARGLRGPPSVRDGRNGPVVRDLRAPPAVRDVRSGPAVRDPPIVRDLRAPPAGRATRDSRGPPPQQRRSPPPTVNRRPPPGTRHDRSGPIGATGRGGRRASFDGAQAPPAIRPMRGPRHRSRSPIRSDARAGRPGIADRRNVLDTRDRGPSPAHMERRHQPQIVSHHAAPIERGQRGPLPLHADARHERALPQRGADTRHERGPPQQPLRGADVRRDRGARQQPPLRDADLRRDRGPPQHPPRNADLRRDQEPPQQPPRGVDNRRGPQQQRRADDRRGPQQHRGADDRRDPHQQQPPPHQRPNDRRDPVRGAPHGREQLAPVLPREAAAGGGGRHRPRRMSDDRRAPLIVPADARVLPRDMHAHVVHDGGATAARRGGELPFEQHKRVPPREPSPQHPPPHHQRGARRQSGPLPSSSHAGGYDSRHHHQQQHHQPPPPASYAHQRDGSRRRSLGDAAPVGASGVGVPRGGRPLSIHDHARIHQQVAGERRGSLPREDDLRYSPAPRSRAPGGYEVIESAHVAASPRGGADRYSRVRDYHQPPPAAAANATRNSYEPPHVALSASAPRTRPHAAAAPVGRDHSPVRLRGSAHPTTQRRPYASAAAAAAPPPSSRLSAATVPAALAAPPPKRRYAIVVDPQTYASGAYQHALTQPRAPLSAPSHTTAPVAIPRGLDFESSSSSSAYPVVPSTRGRGGRGRGRGGGASRGRGRSAYQGSDAGGYRGGRGRGRGGRGRGGGGRGPNDSYQAAW